MRQSNDNDAPKADAPRRLRRAASGFALIDLLVTVGTVALLATVLLPGMSTARVRDRQAACLGNLRQIGAATLAYAAEDQREQLVPLAMVDVRTEGSSSMDEFAYARLAEPQVFGGRTATRDLVGMSGNPKVMRSLPDGGNGYWEARRRPLTRYIAETLGPASAGLAVFHCPADAGYPLSLSQASGCPTASCDVPLYELLGNSYRIDSIGFWIGSVTATSFSTGPQGHTASSIASPLPETILYNEPLFYLMTRIVPGEVPPFAGWHGGLMSDNAVYCDGSARMTEVGELQQFSQAELDAMGVTPYIGAATILRRGPTWQADCYPTPGAAIRKWTFSGAVSYFDLVNYHGWPFEGYQYNLIPE